jgi:hypothetical protein
MNKVITVGMAALMVAGIAGAQDDVVMVGQAPVVDDSRAEITAEAALMSAYVWRGQVYNNDPVVQPQLTISQYDVSLNIWGNYNIAGSDSSGVSSDFSEIDFSLAYTLPVALNELAFDVGAIHYTFPNTDANATTELFLSATVLSWVDTVVAVIPSLTAFYDVDEADGAYFLFDVVFPYEVSEYLAVEGGVSAGYGNTSYNSYYWTGDAGWNDYNFYGNASYEIMEGLTASVNLTYTLLEGGNIKDAANDNYDNDKKFYGGINIAYDL